MANAHARKSHEPKRSWDFVESQQHFAVSGGLTTIDSVLVSTARVQCVEDYAHVGLPLDVDAILLMETDDSSRLRPCSI
jgi:hypothetical protein